MPYTDRALHPIVRGMVMAVTAVTDRECRCTPSTQLTSCCLPARGRPTRLESIRGTRLEYARATRGSPECPVNTANLNMLCNPAGAPNVT